MARRALLAVALIALVPASAEAAGLSAGAGRADITPPTGYFTFGYVRADSKPTGTHTRLYARVLVLERDGRKVALVAEDLGGIAGGMLADAAALVKDRGFSEQNVINSASHTHMGPSGYFNFGTFNTVFPSKATLTGLTTTFDFSVAGDPKLYTFLTKRLAEAIKRADEDRAPASAAWAATTLEGVTVNRSVEAHLANHGIIKAMGEGSPAMDPDGPAHTLDRNVHVLRVDKLGAPAKKKKAKKKRKSKARKSAKRRRKKKKKATAKTTPLGAWSTYANHGTVVKYDFSGYSGDHQAAANRVFEHAVRREAGVPSGQEIVNVYGNGDEGDMSAGLTRSGPAAAEEVGRMEAAKMLDAWRDAGRRLSSTPALDMRWTRVCFCGQQTEGGRVDTRSVIGLPQFTGSDEARGPLYDETGVPFEDRRAPADDPVQGTKIPVVRDAHGGSPTAVPIAVLRVGNGLIATVPGELTIEMGNRVRAAVRQASGATGIDHVAIAGLANEFLNYFTTPEEYQRQFYEGGATVYGRFSANVIKLGLADLAGRLASGQPAPPPHPFDPTNGLHPVSEPFSEGAATGTPTLQPGPIQRLQRARFAWRGGPRGEDRPVDTPFVTIERRDKTGWSKAADDLGLQIMWNVDDAGVYTAQWEAPLDFLTGDYRFVVTANRYRVESKPFALVRARSVGVQGARQGGTFTATLTYPEPIPNTDLTHRPDGPDGGSVTFDVGGKAVTVKRRSGRTFSVPAPAGTPVAVAEGSARDRFGNLNATALPAGAARNAARARNARAVSAYMRRHPPSDAERITNAPLDGLR
ncbi:MAG: neutral/alkaline non-lysosomal ceramidase N-terminal domain-containing protein [Thermoleophilaceae bacterium]|nr:neutral/alkaline non-lysosomal ceramidase N-terminal domain-containing protein [Thermoleophilaceae bacterium]